MAPDWPDWPSQSIEACWHRALDKETKRAWEEIKAAKGLSEDKVRQIVYEEVDALFPKGETTDLALQVQIDATKEWKKHWRREYEELRERSDTTDLLLQQRQAQLEQWMRRATEDAQTIGDLRLRTRKPTLMERSLTVLGLTLSGALGGSIVGAALTLI